MRTPLPHIALLAIMLSNLACNAPLPQSAVTPTTAQVDVATLEATVTSEEQAEVTSPAPNSAFTDQLVQALITEDYAQIKAMMGDAFLIRYVGGDGGLIAVNDAIGLLRTNLMSGPNNIVVEPEFDVSGIASDDLAIVNIPLTNSLFSTGWGSANADHAVILISENASGEPYFAGLLYAANGFAALATPSAEVAEAGTATPSGDSTSPAPRGPITYESDFKRNWPLFDDDHVKTQLTSEGYVIDIVGPWSHWSFTQLVDTNAFYAEVTVTPTTCPESQGSYGLLFDYLETDQFRVLVIECNGTYTLWERTPTANATVLSTGRLPEELDARNGEHRIGILTENDMLVIYVDDYRLGAVGVADLEPGDFGPYVESTGSSTMSALFTRLAIYETK